VYDFGGVFIVFNGNFGLLLEYRLYFFKVDDSDFSETGIVAGGFSETGIVAGGFSETGILAGGFSETGILAGGVSETGIVAGGNLALSFAVASFDNLGVIDLDMELDVDPSAGIVSS